MDVFTGINIINKATSFECRFKMWELLTYPITQFGRKCPTKQPRGCQFPF
nr:MAG TPA: hypothetical protein [Caudoviricetes sp.]